VEVVFLLSIGVSTGVLVRVMRVAVSASPCLAGEEMGACLWIDVAQGPGQEGRRAGDCEAAAVRWSFPVCCEQVRSFRRSFRVFVR